MTTPQLKVDEVNEVARLFLTDVSNYWNGVDVVDGPYLSYEGTEESRRQFFECCLMYLKNVIIAKRVPLSTAQINMFQDVRWTDGVLELAAANLLTAEYQYTSLLRTLQYEVEQDTRDIRDIFRASRSQFANA